MSTTELNQIALFEQLIRKEIKQVVAADALGLSVRQVKRKLHNYRQCGTTSLVHQGRGRASNNMIDQATLVAAISMVKDLYGDFGPTLAHEKLARQHGIIISVERLRQEMITTGLWKPKRRKFTPVHQLRERRACFGELLQIDGSPHDWFEGRAPSCNLNVAVDDARGIPVLTFSPVESTQSYFQLLEVYIAQFGLPRAIYADKHSIFQINRSPTAEYKKPGVSDEAAGLTQFGRAMKELGIELIAASSPQAKGRVERLNSTLQDRLVKELRLQHISSIAAANNFVPTFCQQYGDQFGVSARSSVDMHQPVSKNIQLTKILCVKERRTLSKNLTCQYRDGIYQITTKCAPYVLRHTPVTLYERYDGQLIIRDDKGTSLAFSLMKTVRQTRELNTKEINPTLDGILEKQARQIQLKHNPWESDQSDFDGPNLYQKMNTIV